LPRRLPGTGIARVLEIGRQRLLETVAVRCQALRLEVFGAKVFEPLYHIICVDRSYIDILPIVEHTENLRACGAQRSCAVLIHHAFACSPVPVLY